MSAPTILIATAKVRAGEEKAFAAWQVRHNAVVAKFPGLLGSEILPPGSADSNEWTIVLNFQTPDQLTTWQKSPERAALIAESVPFLEGGNLGEAASAGGGYDQPTSNVTEVILSKIKPGMDDVYREWAVRIQHAQAKYPGYRGMYLQPPTNDKDGRWTTLVRYDTTEHLEAWMASAERAELLQESKAFIESEELTQLATSFPGWVPLDPSTGKGPPNWKTAMLVLLGLFPTVMLEMRFLSPFLQGFSLNSSLATFIGNTISVAFTTYVTMPLCVRWFTWWLFPKDDKGGTTAKGLLLMILLFAIEVAVLWKLLPW